uniref:MFS transporter n=1 Tax=Rhodococcus qingshengii TaxID=334542 RepID=UPI001C4E1040|nr:MFS transporter [Rhodococcus qingshengii]
MSLVLDKPVSEMAGPYRYRWYALAVLCASLLVVVMANTSLIVAIPSMTEDLQLTSSQLQWVIDGYTVPYAALMLLFGALGDRLGRRRALLTGLVIFGIGSALGSLATSTGEVIAWRLVMGIGAAVIMPATLSLLVVTFPRAERARAIAIWAATSGLGIALGPLLAGAMLQQWTWHSTFLANVGVVVVCIVAALAVVPPSRVAVSGGIDWVGGLLSILTIGGSVYAIIDGLHAGWSSGPVAAGVTALAAAAAFVWWERRHPHPLLNVRRLGERKIGGSLLSVALLFLAAFGTIYFVAQYFQFVFGYGPLETGIRLLPLALAVTVGSIVSGRLLPRFGERTLITAGIAVAAVGILMLTQIGDTPDYSWFAIAITVLGAGMGIAEPPATDAIMGGFSEEELGSAGGINDTAIEFGGALGIAVLGSVLSSSYSSSFDHSAAVIEPAQATSSAAPDISHTLEVGRESIGSASVLAQHLGSDATTAPLAEPLTRLAQTAFTSAVETTSLIAGAMLVIGALLVGVILPSHRKGRKVVETKT